MTQFSKGGRYEENGVILLLLSLCFKTYGEGMCKFGVEVGCDTFVVIWEIHLQ